MGDQRDERPTNDSPEPVPSPVSDHLRDDTPRPRPSILFLLVISGAWAVLDLGTKEWAVHALERVLPDGRRVPQPIRLADWLTLVLARNEGGVWGVFQDASHGLRRPLFVLVSVLAIGFIVYLFRRLHVGQHALRWGLPFVLGGAVGNLVDRVRYGWVVDFIDYRATWVRWLNEVLARVNPAHDVTDHWPTYNVADIAICVGVGLMAIDMFIPRRHPKSGAGLPPSPPDAASRARET